MDRLRWKIFVPVAAALTLLGIWASKGLSASASQRQLSLLQHESAVEMTFTEDGLEIVLAAGEDLAGILARLDPQQVDALAKDKNVYFARADAEPAAAAAAQKVDLILAQAAATGKYYEASVHLEQLAAGWGYSSSLVVWGERIVAEIGTDRYNFIGLRKAGLKQ